MIFTAYNDANFQMTDGGILIKAKPHSDMVVDAQTAAIISNASYLAQDVEGDFTFSALVSHRFLSTYDACCLIAYANDKLWSKACFECTEEGEHAVVTVMTNGLSDDANSVRITGESVWLRMCRKGDVISVQYSENGADWFFVRILHIPLPNKVRLGILAQSPVGDGGDFLFRDITLIEGAPANMRFGN